MDDLWFYATDREGEDAVMYLPSFRDCASYHDELPALLQCFAQHGFTGFSAPYRGLLDQPGSFDVFSMIDDAVEYAQLLDQRFSPDTITAIGNSIGGIAALGGAAETDLIDRVATMNTPFTFRNEAWWYDDPALQKRLASWRLIEMGEAGPYGTAFRGLEEAFYKENVCRLEDDAAGTISFDERASELVEIPILLMVSHEDDRVDPVHTWTLYRHVLNAEAAAGVDGRTAVRVICKEDPSHTLLLNDEELHQTVIRWIRSDG